MNRKTILSLFVCLLCLLPCLTWAQSLTGYEYWFDDDFSGKVSGSLSGTDAVFKSDISTDQLDNGVHKFSFRTKQSDGKYSAITSSLFLKRPAAQSSVMEFWFDDNFEQRESISISSTEDEQEMTLDLQNNTKYPLGFHILNMRFNIEGEGMSAVTTTPIMVKLRDNTEGLTMESYTIAVDNGTPIEYPVLNKKEAVTIPHVLDARTLSLGEHTLKASFKNSLGVSLKLEEPFTVVAPDNPSITLTGWCFDGWLHLDFNSIPNDVSYTVIERGVDGIERPVFKRVASFYPEYLKALPEPISIGVATYYVKATYLDKYDHEQEIKSNEVTLENTSPPATSLYGCIVGRIQLNAQGSALMSPHAHLYVNYNDGKNVEKILVNPNGTFDRDYIPFGTTVTLSIEDDDYYNYESITVNVDKDTRNQMQVINATAHDDVAVNISNEKADLKATSFSWNDRIFNFEVTNISSTYQTFSGVLEMIAFESKQGQYAVFDPTKPYYHAGSVYIKNLNFGKSKNVSVTLDNLPKLKKDKYFTFYFVTQKDEQSTTKQYKQLLFENNQFTNPMTLPVSPNPTIDDVEFPDFDSFIK